MVRPFRVKLRKLKKRKLEEEEEEPAPVNAEEEKISPVNCGGEAEEGGSDDEKKAEAAVNEMAGIPISQPLEGSKKLCVIFVFERASLEFAKVGKIQSSSSNVEAGSASKKARWDNRRRI